MEHLPKLGRPTLRLVHDNTTPILETATEVTQVDALLQEMTNLLPETTSEDFDTTWLELKTDAAKLSIAEAESILDLSTLWEVELGSGLEEHLKREFNRARHQRKVIPINEAAKTPELILLNTIFGKRWIYEAPPLPVSNENLAALAEFYESFARSVAEDVINGHVERADFQHTIARSLHQAAVIKRHLGR